MQIEAQPINEWMGKLQLLCKIDARVLNIFDLEKVP